MQACREAIFGGPHSAVIPGSPPSANLARPAFAALRLSLPIDCLKPAQTPSFPLRAVSPRVVAADAVVECRSKQPPVFHAGHLAYSDHKMIIDLQTERCRLLAQAPGVFDI